MNKFLLLFAICIIQIDNSYACDCIGPSDSSFKDLLSDSDLIFTGTVLTSNHWNKKHQESNDLNKQGANVLIVVDSVINGDLAIGDTIYLYQFFSSGSCTNIYDYGSSHLIIGELLKSVKQIISDDQIEYEMEPNSDSTETVSNRRYAKEIIQFLNSQLTNYMTVKADMCSSFKLNTIGYRQAMKILK